MPKLIIEIDLPEGQSLRDPAAITRIASPDWIASWWSILDVQDCVDFEMTDEECREVLRRVDKYHDADIGINWEVLQHYADQVVEERETVLE